ncbi:predicted protein [Chaetoceros tenuissimus]|uniref:Uncharacterized protein n=1 Tax=Chaetoceros tenuissimus TaxID=426638 RepID=A0AAD3CI51_9STRA|nr:predicted protein [Chaetoceros tenuissimus]
MQVSSLSFNQYSCIISRSSPKFNGESKFKHERAAEVAHHSEKQAPSQTITSTQFGSLKFDGESKFKHERSIRLAHHSENQAPSQSITSTQFGR